MPVRSKRVRSACPVGGCGRSPLRAAPRTRHPLVGGGMLAATAAAVGFAYDAGTGDKDSQRRLLGLLRRGLPVGGARGAAVGRLLGGHPAAVDPLLRRPDGLLRLPRQQDHRHQGHPDQLRLSADRALPADVLHVRGGAGDRPGPLVPRLVDTASDTQGRRGRSHPSGGRSAGCRRATTIDAVEATPRHRRRERHRPPRPRDHHRSSEEVPRRPKDHGPPRPREHRARAMRGPPKPSSPSRRPTDRADGPGRRSCRPKPPSDRKRTRAAAPRDRGATCRLSIPAHTRACPNAVRRPTGYDPYDPFEPRSTNSAGATHHPVSRVRYRGADDGESRSEYRNRPRRPRNPVRTPGSTTSNFSACCGARAGSRGAARTPMSRWRS